jgi:hypothetical protein
VDTSLFARRLGACRQEAKEEEDHDEWGLPTPDLGPHLERLSSDSTVARLVALIKGVPGQAGTRPNSGRPSLLADAAR